MENAMRHLSSSPMDTSQRQIRTVENAATNQGQVSNNDDSDGIDRISDLPDDIICHILSFLPTRIAVHTSVLSTRWKILFPLIPNLKIELNDFKRKDSASETSQIMFKNFVDRLLNVTLRSVPYVPSIYCFCLDCHRCNDGRKLAGWVNAALSLNIKRIDLCIWELTNSNILMDSLFGANITKLSLSITLGDIASEYRFSLPNLKELSVQRMKSKAVNVLLKSCPSLTSLSLSYIHCDSGSVLRVCIPSLRFLELSDLLNSLEGGLVLDAPLLEHIRYTGFLPKLLLVKKLKFLKVAQLNAFEIFNLFNERVDVLIEACSGVEKLWLSNKVLRMLNRLPRPLVRFQRLFHLQVSRMDTYGWQLLPSLLDSAPNLKKLDASSGFVSGSYKRFMDSLRKPLSVRLTRHGETGFCLEFYKLKPNM